MIGLLYPARIILGNSLRLRLQEHVYVYKDVPFFLFLQDFAKKEKEKVFNELCHSCSGSHEKMYHQ